MKYFAHHLPIHRRNYVRRIATHVILLLFIFVLAGCSRIKSDAKKAAKLTNSSIELAIELKFEDAEKMYNKAQKIIRKYQKTEKEEEFFQRYQAYRDKTKSVSRQK